MAGGSWVLKILGAAFASHVIYHVYVIVYHNLVLEYPDKYFDVHSEHLNNRGAVNDTCNNGFEHIRTVHNVHTFADAEVIIKEGGDRSPIMFKKFLHNPQEKWDEILEHHAESEISFTNMKLVGFGNMWLNGFISLQPVVVKLGEYFEFSKKSAPGETMFASFVAFVKGQEVTGNSKDDVWKGLKDTSFISNFPEDIVGTSIHAACLARSYAIMYFGVKLWVFVSPRDMEMFETINTPTNLVMRGSEKEYLLSKAQSTVPIAVQHPGDMMYFPPDWGHTVVTKAGPCAMLNLRQIGILQSLWHTPWRGIEGLVIKIKDGIKGRIKGEESIQVYTPTKMHPVQRALQFRPTPDTVVTDSPCKDVWKGFLASEDFKM